MYIKTVNGEFEKFYSVSQLRKDNPKTSFPENVSDAMLAEYGVYPVTRTDPPSFDSETQMVSQGIPALVGGVWTQTWELVELTEEQLAERTAQRREAAKQRRVESESLEQALNLIAEELVLPKIEAMEDPDPEDIEKYGVFFEIWEPGIVVVAGKFYWHEEVLYRCITSHTTQSDWEPQTVPALFTPVRDTGQGGGQPDAWVQPIGSEDAYQIGDRVTHNGQIWVSTHANNVWEPGVFGWVVET